MQYQTASAMYDALKRRMLVQKKLKFLGYHAIVAVYTTLDDTSEIFDLIPMMEFLKCALLAA